jgi:DNA-binding CsgD family transcriptional regulator
VTGSASSSASEPPIRGRADELALARSSLTSLAAGVGGILVVEGPAGIGKSRLITEMMTMAQKSGIRTLCGRAVEYQQTVPFYLLFTATLHASPPVGDAEALRRLGASDDLRYWVVHDLHAAIRAAAADTPLLIVLEDIHWADNATVSALRTLTTTLRDSAVLWVMSVRTGTGGSAVNDFLQELERREATCLRLTAMPRSGVIDMVEDGVRARADVSLLNMAAKAHGNPFLITELLGGLSEEGRLEVDRGCAVAIGEALPRRLGTSMRHRLDALSDATREVVQVAAVLPDRFSAALLAQMLERRPVALVSAVDEAVGADLLAEDGDGLRFGHDLLREATRQSLPQSLRRAIERQSAAVMMEMGAAPEEVATQLARSAEVGDQAAIAALRQAAQSVANSDQSGAADLSRRALDLLPPQHPERGSLLAETVGLLNRSARYQEAEDLAVAMLSQLSPEEEAHARLRIPAAADALEDRITENRRALQLTHISDITRARHYAWLACNHAVSGLSPDESVITQAIAAAEATKDPESRIICETSLAILDYVDGRALRALQRLENVNLHCHGEDPSFAYTLAGIHHTHLLTFMGRHADASAVATQGLEAARREGNEMAVALWSEMNAVGHFGAGRLSAARATLDAVPSQSWGVQSEMGMNRWLILAEVAVRTGDRNLLQAAVIEARKMDPSGATLVSRGAAYILSLAAWHHGDEHEALRWLANDNGRILNPLWLNHFDQLIFSARAAAVAGDAGLRARVLRSVELLEGDSTEIGIFAAVIGHTRGILERDPAALLGAAAALDPYRPLLSASATEDAGLHFAGAGHNSEAIAALNAAFDGYVRCEATEDARRVGRALRGLGVERRIVTQPRERTGWARLTEAELRIVRLIADGATNADVAARLQLSPHTVKSHVRNSFAKLGINSRSQLAELMDDDDGSRTG